jgi:hypothetical protein
MGRPQIILTSTNKTASLWCLWFVVGGRRPWRECAYVRTWYILHTFFWLCTRATISFFIVKPTVLLIVPPNSTSNSAETSLKNTIFLRGFGTIRCTIRRYYFSAGIFFPHEKNTVTTSPSPPPHCRHLRCCTAATFAAVLPPPPPPRYRRCCRCRRRRSRSRSRQ